jgi:hypothetical protein
MDLTTPVTRPPYPGTHLLIVVTYPPPKICLQVLKNARFGEITFLEKNQKKCLTNSLSATASSSNMKFDNFN